MGSDPQYAPFALKRIDRLLVSELTNQDGIVSAALRSTKMWRSPRACSATCGAAACASYAPAAAMATAMLSVTTRASSVSKRALLAGS